MPGINLPSWAVWALEKHASYHLGAQELAHQRNVGTDDEVTAAELFSDWYRVRSEEPVRVIIEGRHVPQMVSLERVAGGMVVIEDFTETGFTRFVVVPDWYRVI